MSRNVAARVAAAVLVAVAVFPAAAAAQGTRPDASALYPGAASYVPELHPMSVSVRETLLGLPGTPALLSGATENFLTTDDVGKVDAYDKAKLRPVPGSFAGWTAIDPRKLAAGSSTPVHFQSYTEFGLTNYLYHWWKREPNEDVTLVEVRFAIGYSLDPKLANRNTPGTWIVVTTKTFSQSAPNLAPSEQDLGAPIYPGAVYDSHASQIQGDGQFFLHRYVTADAVGQVVAFYERAFGRKAMEGAPVAGGVNSYFRPYSAGAPDDWAVIESIDPAAGPFRTAIIFHLTRFAPEEKPEVRRQDAAAERPFPF